jgi:hypothetical protein
MHAPLGGVGLRRRIPPPKGPPHVPAPPKTSPRSRAEIDRIDEDMHRLLMERGADHRSG